MLHQGDNWWWHFFSNPLVGVIGTLASVIGVVLAIYFYFNGAQHREFVYMVNPARAIVVKSGQASKLKVLFGSEELHGDITAAQFAFWNQGKESIRNTNILETVMIVAEPSVPILEATVRKQSRDVVHVILDDHAASQGTLSLSWQILEAGDGAVIQIVYAGGTEVHLKARGVIEGQHALKELSGGAISSDASLNFKGKAKYIFALFLSAMAAVCFWRIWVRITLRTSDRRFYLIGYGVNLVLISILAYEVFLSQPIGPPFGF